MAHVFTLAAFALLCACATSVGAGAITNENILFKPHLPSVKSAYTKIAKRSDRKALGGKMLPAPPQTHTAAGRPAQAILGGSGGGGAFAASYWEITQQPDGGGGRATLKGLPAGDGRRYRLIVDVGLTRARGSPIACWLKHNPDAALLGLEADPFVFAAALANTLPPPGSARPPPHNLTRDAARRVALLPVAAGGADATVLWQNAGVQGGDDISNRHAAWLPQARLDRLLAWVPKGYSFLMLNVGPGGPGHFAFEGAGKMLKLFSAAAVECGICSRWKEGGGQCDQQAAVDLAVSAGLVHAQCDTLRCVFAKTARHFQWAKKMAALNNKGARSWGRGQEANHSCERSAHLKRFSTLQLAAADAAGAAPQPPPPPPSFPRPRSEWECNLPTTKRKKDWCPSKAMPFLLHKVYAETLPRHECKQMARVGRRGDGGKITCMDNIVAGDCVVYSLGSRLDFSFEVAMWKRKQCEIHTFDCTVGTLAADMTLSGKKVPTNVRFHPWCLGSKNTVKPFSSDVTGENVGFAGNGTYFTLATVMKKLGHARIDLLKMDIERHELDVVDGLNANVDIGQILFETHLHNAYGMWGRPVSEREWSALWTKLKSMGFLVFSFKPNKSCRCCCEYSIMKVQRAALAPPPGGGDRKLAPCLKSLASNMPVDAVTGEMKVHHCGTHGKKCGSKWNEMERWRPLDLHPPCTIWYVGANTHGYDGVRLQRKYHCQIHVFEPVPSFYKQLRKNWGTRVPRATIHEFGLGNRTRVVDGVVDRGQSTFAMANRTSATAGARIVVRDTLDVWKELGRPTIDLLHVNCEGCEWELFGTLLEHSMTKRIHTIQVGTHWFAEIENIEQQYCAIQNGLRLWHKEVFRQAFGWERWEHKYGRLSQGKFLPPSPFQ